MNTVLQSLKCISRSKYLLGLFLPFGYIDGINYLVIQSIEEIAEMNKSGSDMSLRLLETTDLIGVHYLMMDVFGIACKKYVPVFEVDLYHLDYIHNACKLLRQRIDMDVNAICLSLYDVICKEIYLQSEHHDADFYDTQYIMMCCNIIKMCYRCKTHTFDIFKILNFNKYEDMAYNYIMKSKFKLLHPYVYKMKVSGEKSW
jgi:hypothetical protein